MTDAAVLVPVLRRPERVRPLLASLAASQGDVRLQALFVCSGGDDAEAEAVDAEGATRLTVPTPPGPGDYARKINYAFRWAVQHRFKWVFLGADDLAFHPGWADVAVAAHENTGACVIGTNDLGNAEVMSGRHATHSLVHRNYLECGTVDEAEKVLHEGYHHQFVDNEFVQTAMARGTFTFARDSVAEHLHWAWGKGKRDEIYEKGEQGYAHDRAVYESRKYLWGR